MSDDAPSYARAAGRALAAGSLVSGIAAIVAYQTGEVVGLRSAVVRTNTDATWVLGVLALLLLIGAYAVYSELRREREQDELRRKPEGG